MYKNKEEVGRTPLTLTAAYYTSNIRLVTFTNKQWRLWY